MINILIVEDNKAEADFCVKLIKELDDRTNVFVTEYANDAIKMINNESIDAVLIDKELPDIDGFELASQIRKNDDYHLLPIVFVTATDMNTVELYSKYHNYDYILKPFDAKTFCDVMKPLISGLQKKTKSNSIIFELGGDTVSIDINNIYYAEVINKKTFLITKTRKIEVKGFTLTDVIEKINKPFFIRCHKSCAANINSINRIERVTKKTRDIIFSDNKAKCPLGDNYYNEVKALLEESRKDGK